MPPRPPFLHWLLDRDSVLIAVLCAIAIAIGLAVAIAPYAVVLPIAGTALLLIGRTETITVRTAALVGIVAANSFAVWRYLWLVEDYEIIFHILRLGVPLVVLVLLVFTSSFQVARDRLLLPMLPVIGYCAWGAIGGLLATVPSTSLLFSCLIALFSAVIALALTHWDDPAEFWRWWLRAMAAVTVPLNLGSFAIWALGVEGALAPRYVGTEWIDGIRGLLENPGMAGEHALISIAVMLGLRVLEPEEPMPLWMKIALPLTAFLVMLSLSRAVALGLVVGGGLYVGVTQRGRGASGSRARIAGVLLGVALVGLLFSPLGRGTVSRIGSADSSISEASTGRTELWKGAFLGLVRHPLTGYGLGSSPVTETEGVERFFDKHHTAHSAFVDYMILPGLPAAAFMFAMLLRALHGLWRWRRSNLAWSVGFVGGTLALPFLLNNTPLPNGPWAWVFWLLLIFPATLDTWEAEEAGPQGAVTG